MNKSIFKLAIPNIISNITVPLLGLVDLFIMGHMESENYLGAIALGGMIFNVIYMGFGFLRMGTSGFSAQALGARNLKETILIFSRALSVGFIAGFTLIVLQKPIEIIGFCFIKGSPEVELLAKSYFQIRIFAAPATIALYAITGWFIGMQNARFPMIVAVFINVLNIGFNYLFAVKLNLKSNGVALGTVCAQYSGLILAMVLFRIYYFKITKYWSYKEMINWKSIKIFFDVNKNIFIRTICLIAAISFFTAKGAAQSDTILAANTLLFQFFLIFSFFIDGFAYAAEALIGKYKGAKNIALLKKTVISLFFWGAIITFIFSFIYIFGKKTLIEILTNQPQTIEIATDYLKWVAMIPIASFAAFIWDGIYIGVTETVYMRNLMLISTLIYFVAYFIFFPIWGNDGLWAALLIFLFSRGLLQTIFYKKGILTKLYLKNE